MKLLIKRCQCGAIIATVSQESKDKVMQFTGLSLDDLDEFSLEESDGNVSIQKCKCEDIMKTYLDDQRKVLKMIQTTLNDLAKKCGGNCSTQCPICPRLRNIITFITGE